MQAREEGSSSSGSGSSSSSSKDVKEWVLEAVEHEQTKREVLLALQLRDRVQPYVEGDQEEWRKNMKKEVKELCSVYQNEGLGFIRV